MSQLEGHEGVYCDGHCSTLLWLEWDGVSNYWVECCCGWVGLSVLSEMAAWRGYQGHLRVVLHGVTSAL